MPQKVPSLQEWTTAVLLTINSIVAGFLLIRWWAIAASIDTLVGYFFFVCARITWGGIWVIRYPFTCAGEISLEGSQGHLRFKVLTCIPFK